MRFNCGSDGGEVRPLVAVDYQTAGSDPLVPHPERVVDSQAVLDSVSDPDDHPVLELCAEMFGDLSPEFLESSHEIFSIFKRSRAASLDYSSAGFGADPLRVCWIQPQGRADEPGRFWREADEDLLVSHICG